VDAASNVRGKGRNQDEQTCTRLTFDPYAKRKRNPLRRRNEQARRRHNSFREIQLVATAYIQYTAVKWKAGTDFVVRFHG